MSLADRWKEYRKEHFPDSVFTKEEIEQLEIIYYSGAAAFREEIRLFSERKSQ